MYEIDAAQITPEYLVIALRSPQLQERVNDIKSKGIKNEQGADFLRSLEIPLPSLDEQAAIVARIERQQAIRPLLNIICDDLCPAALAPPTVTIEHDLLRGRIRVFQITLPPRDYVLPNKFRDRFTRASRQIRLVALLIIDAMRAHNARRPHCNIMVIHHLGGSRIHLPLAREIADELFFCIDAQNGILTHVLRLVELSDLLKLGITLRHLSPFFLFDRPQASRVMTCEQPLDRGDPNREPTRSNRLITSRHPTHFGIHRTPCCLVADDLQ